MEEVPRGWHETRLPAKPVVREVKKFFTTRKSDFKIQRRGPARWFVVHELRLNTAELEMLEKVAAGDADVNTSPDPQSSSNAQTKSITIDTPHASLSTAPGIPTEPDIRPLGLVKRTTTFRIRAAGTLRAIRSALVWSRGAGNTQNGSGTEGG